MDTRDTGIGMVGHVPWGTHFAQLYSTREDLLEMLVPFLKAGLEDDEYCLYVTAPPLTPPDVWAELARSVPDLDAYRRRGFIEVYTHRDWYLSDGGFDPEQVLQRWFDKHDTSVLRGCSGMRVAGNLGWAGPADFASLVQHEVAIDEEFGPKHVLTLCAYPLDRCSAPELADVLKNHEFTLIRRDGEWEPFQSLDPRRLGHALTDERERLAITLENIGDAVITTDTERRVTSLNPVAERLTGWTGAQAASQPLGEVVRIVDEATGEPAPDLVLAVLERKAVVTEESRRVLIAQDGALTAVAGSAAPIRGRDGDLLGVVLVLHDARAARQAEGFEAALRETEEKLRSALGAGERLAGELRDGEARLRAAQEAISAGEQERDRLLGQLREADAWMRAAQEAISAGEQERDRLLGQLRDGEAWMREAQDAIGAGEMERQRLAGEASDAEARLRAAAAAIEAGEQEHDRLREALRRSEERFQALASTTIDHVIVQDLELRNEMVINPQRGLTEAEMLGKTDHDLMRKEDADVITQIKRRVIETRQPVHLEVPLVNRRGESEFFDGSYLPRIDAAGQVVGVISCFRNVTDRRRSQQALHASEARYQALFEGLRDGFAFCRVAWDGQERPADFVFLHVNEAFERLTGLRDVVGKNAASVIPGIWESEPGLLETCARVARTGRSERFQIHIRPLAAWFDVSAYCPVPGHFVALFDSIAARKSATVEPDPGRNDFLAALSHELQSPLATISNSLFVLDHAPPGAEPATRARQIIGRQVALVSHLVDDLLDVARITRGKVQLQKERIDLNEAVRRAAEDRLPQFERAGVHLDLIAAPEPIHVLADGPRIAQIIGQLLQNSAKFARPGGRACLSVTVEGTEALLRVTDDGMGMAPDTLARLFEPFMHADQALDHSPGGLGLGLVLVKGIVELHGGRVSAKSEGLGQGAEILVRLPLDGEAAVASSAPVTARRRVLVIESNPDAADTLRDVLELGGYEVAVAYHGPDGIAKAREFEPEVVLCDLALPGMDGYQVAHAFRSDATLAKAHLVAVTGYVLPEDLQRATQAGFVRHLPKPPSPAALEAVLADLGTEA